MKRVQDKLIQIANDPERLHHFINNTMEREYIRRNFYVFGLACFLIGVAVGLVVK